MKAPLRIGGAAWLVAALFAGCGHDRDHDEAPPTAVAGATQDGQPPPTPVPAPAPAPAPSPPPGPAIGGSELLAALRGYVPREFPVAVGPPSGWMLLYPGGALRPVSSGVFYAWSQPLEGGQATVSGIHTQAGTKLVTLEFLVAGGDASYVADLSLKVEDPPAQVQRSFRLDDVLRVSATDRVPLDVPIATWRAAEGPTVDLLVLRVDASDSGHRVCWRVRDVDLDRTACSVHGRDFAGTLEDTGPAGTASLATTPGPVPWNPNPPAGTQAPDPVPNPIRYAYGTDVLAAINFGSLRPQGVSIALTAADGSDGAASLAASSTGGVAPNPWQSVASSRIDGARPVELAFLADPAYRTTFGGRLRDFVLRTGDGTRVLQGDGRLSPAAIYPLDTTLFEVVAPDAAVASLLQSNDGGPVGFRTCWRIRFGTTDRLACSVIDVPGSGGLVVDSFAGRTTTYR